MVTEPSTNECVGNLPLAATAEFTSDDLALILGSSIPDAVCVFDGERGCVVAANLKFLGLSGLGLEFVESSDVPFERVVLADDRAVFNAWRGSVLKGESRVLDVRIQRPDGSLVPVSLHLRAFFWRRRQYILGFVRETTPFEGRLAELRGELEEQKARTVEAIRRSLRLYQLNEKIKRTPRMARTLLNLDNEQELFVDAARILTSEEGLNYRDATFLLLEGDLLRVAFSTAEDLVGQSFPIHSPNRYSAFIQRRLTSDPEAHGGIIVPLQCRGQLVGLCEVTPHAKEQQLFQESNILVEWQMDVLKDVGGILALLIDNLRLNREIKRQSLIDPLTQAFNRYYFVDRLAGEVRRARRYSRPISLIFVDVDEFKSINDRHGHLQGDQVLRELSGLFREALRQVDVVCRYGGDEFVILLPETDEETAVRIADKLLRAVQAHGFSNLEASDSPLPVTVSFGVSTLKSDQSEEQLLRAADTALYKAKRKGRNTVASQD